jgi:hypothetical protein
VQLSYGLTLPLVPTILLASMWARLHGEEGVSLGELSRVVAMVCVGVLALKMTEMWRHQRRGRQGPVRRISV